MDSKLAYVKHHIDDGIATITFFHPKGNSFPSHQLRLLENQIKELGKNERVKVIVLESQGDSIFCAGASFTELVSLKSSADAKSFFMGFAKVILAMRDCPKFILGAIEGKAVGGGVGLVSACDYAIATNNASIKLSELSIGIGPFVIEPALRRKMGLRAVSALTLKPKEWKSAEWAMEYGLYNSVHESKELFENEIKEFSKELSAYSLEAMKDLKSIFWEGTENWKSLLTERAEMSGKLVLTETSKKILAEITNS